MKIAKRTVTLAMVAMMIVSVLSVPASAASSTWVNRFKKFAATSTSSYQTGYTKAIQSILMEYNDNTYGYIFNNGGVDGIYGTNTKLAVQEFQDGETSIASGNDEYGKVKSTTWGKMAEVMTANDNSTPVKFYMNTRNAITAKYSGGVYNFYYHNTYGTEGSKFASVY